MAATQIGPSTSQTPYLVATANNVTFTSIISAGDGVAGSNIPGTNTPWRFAGIPDGIGAYDNGNGTMTVLLNHELSNTAGTVRSHGSIGAFVDRLVIDKASLQVLSAGDLVTSPNNVFTWNVGTSSYVAGTTVWNRFCSADLPAPSALFDAATGLGTQNRLYFTGEETGPEGRPFGFIVSGPNQGQAYELPRLGNMAYENLVLNPSTGTKTVAMMTDDQSPTTTAGNVSQGGQVYIYAGDKQSTGTDIDKAGLNNGKLYGIVVPALGSGAAANETDATNFEAGTAFTVAAIGNNGDVSGLNGSQIQADSEAKGVAEFLRPEDGAWDTINPNRYYFHTTNGITSPSRLWALDFVDAKDPTKGGTLRELLNGTEGHVMLDNMTVTQDGKLVLQEDPGNNARLSKIWQYDPATDTLTQIGEHDPARFSGLTPPFNQDEESSGVLDVTSILGSPGKQVFLLDVQAHYAFGDPTIVEGGQLLTMTIDRSIQGTSGNDILTGGLIGDAIFGREGNDTINGGRGTNFLDGGLGDDTAAFDFRLADASFSTVGGRPAVTLGDSTNILSGFEHYRFTDGTIDTNDGSPLVDDLSYNIRNKDVFAAKMDADTHYAQFGWREGRDPDAFFSTKGYLSANPDVARANINPLTHYDQFGWKEGRDPSASFDNELYLARNADVRASGMDPLAHYLQFGQDEGRQIGPAIGTKADVANNSFDREFYLLSNSDVGEAGIDPFQHYLQSGAKEGRNPNAFFDTKGYLAAYGDVAASGINPLVHYDQFGWKEGRDPSGAFDTSSYLAANKDVAAANIDPLTHYLEFGIYEGRAAFADGSFVI